jgi:lipopolysaccharide export system protein LptC
MSTTTLSGASALRWLQNLWYHTAMYLPVVMIALLALGTWWLARNTPILSAPTAEEPAKHEPDYFMRNFAVKNFDPTGQLKSEVAGVEGRHFPDTDVLEIDTARLRSYKDGRMTTATANRAYSNGDGSEVQLVGNALVVREAGQDANGKAYPRLEFRGEFLHAFLSTEQIKSHKPVTITRGRDQFVADSLQYDNLERVALLQGRVRGTLMPGRAP